MEKLWGGWDLSVSLCKVSAEQKIWLAEDRCCFSPEVTVGLRSCWQKLKTKTSALESDSVCVYVCARFVCACECFCSAITTPVLLGLCYRRTPETRCVCAMRGCETTSCRSVLSAGRHRGEQTCVSMAMSGCSPFPMCWDRGMNEKGLCAHTHTHTQKKKVSWSPLHSDIWLHGNSLGVQPKLLLLCSSSVCACLSL